MSAGALLLDLRMRRPSRRLYCDPFELRIWVAIQQWCYDPRHEKYPKYGGRGVVVCERWMDSFANFVQDMIGYDKLPRGTVLARHDRSGPFSPENCYWKQQRPNTAATQSKPSAAKNRRTDRYSDRKIDG